jgi:hypothetical protein
MVVGKCPFKGNACVCAHVRPQVDDLSAGVEVTEV